MKNYIVILVSVAVISALAFATGLVTIGAGNVSASPGSTDVAVPVNLENNDSVAILDFTLTHTPYITLTGVQNTTRMKNATIEYYAINDTTLNVAVFVPENISAGSGPIMNLFFNVNSSAVPGNHSLDMTDIILVNVESDNINYTVSSGIFTIL